MYIKLFSERGLSLDRLRALVEVGASGSIVQAAGNDAVRQSQYSRQIKELEAFFKVELVERQGKGIRLTAQGRELAKISRFFLMGLSNFQRGCLAEPQTFRVGAGAAFLQIFLAPRLTEPGTMQANTHTHYDLEAVNDEEIERRLHILTLDFGITMHASLSRPLQSWLLYRGPLMLWVPKKLAKTAKQALFLFLEKRLPLVLSTTESPLNTVPLLQTYEPHFRCNHFLEINIILEQESLAGILPEFVTPVGGERRFFRLPLPGPMPPELCYYLAWNPRLLRLNAHAVRQRDHLLKCLTGHPPVVNHSCRHVG